MRFIVLDELHTYRGRQGADIAMLMKRIRGAVKGPLVCIGTLATMATGVRNHVMRNKPWPKWRVDLRCCVRTKCGRGGVVERDTTLRAKDFESNCKVALKETIPSNGAAHDFLVHPLAVWLERTVALKEEGNDFVRRPPFTLTAIVQRLAKETDKDPRNAPNA